VVDETELDKEHVKIADPLFHTKGSRWYESKVLSEKEACW
jgi:hypothetical protein